MKARELCAGLTLATMAALGPSATESADYYALTSRAEFDAASAAAWDENGSVDPTAARLAIAGGFRCSLRGVVDSYETAPSGRGLPLTALEVDEGKSWSNRALAALAQYDKNDAVLWDGGSGAQVYRRTENGYENLGMGMMVVHRVARDNEVPSIVEAPTAAVESGDTILAYELVVAQTGNAEEGTLQYTVGKFPCGAVVYKDGRWMKDSNFNASPTVVTCSTTSASACSDAIDGRVYPAPEQD